MAKASEIWTSVFGNLAQDFEEEVRAALVNAAFKDYATDYSCYARSLPALREWMDKNEVPGDPALELTVDRCFYKISINGVAVNNCGLSHRYSAVFDWEVSAELEQLHADDYEISKDSLYDYSFYYEPDYEADEDRLQLEEGNVSSEYWERKYPQYFVA